MKERDNSGLCSRQREFAELIRDGLSLQDIAKRMACTEGTVKTYIVQIKRILGVQSMWGLRRKLREVA
jgi:DNA-binding NarL/FixJ family response regulator